MKAWYSAQELVGLPGLPGTDRRVRTRAEKEGWQCRKRSIGKGLEYAFDSLPEATRLVLLKDSARALLTQAPLPVPRKNQLATVDTEQLARTRTEGDAKAAALDGKARLRMDARLEVLRQFERYCAQENATAHRKFGGKYHKSAFAIAWNKGEIASSARDVIPILSSDKLTRWHEHCQREGLARLAGKEGHRKGQTLIDTQPQLVAALKALLCVYPHVSPGIAHNWLVERYETQVLPATLAGDGPIRVPCVRTIARWLDAWKKANAEIYVLLSNPDQWKSRYMLGWGDASANIIRLNQVWEFDSTPADVLLTDGRHSILGVIDVYSRRVRLHVSKTSKATAVAHLLRGALLDWGVPEIATTDNGQEYVSHHLARIFHALGIDQQMSQPFSPWQKPFIERFFRTFSHDLLEYLPGYIGHNVAEREALRARQQFSDRLFVKDRTVELSLTADQLQDFCDQWVLRYHHTPHTGLSGQRPLDRVLSAPPPRRIENTRVLDLLLSEAPGNGYRTVTKTYGLQIESYHYGALELALCVGQRVKVLYDPEGDMGKVYVFDAHGDFICVAECPEITGVDRRQFAIACKAVQRANAQRLRRESRAAAKTLNVRATFEQVLARRDELLSLPSPDDTEIESHETKAMRAALDALANRSPLGIGEGFTPQKAREMGYLDDLKAETKAAKAFNAPVPVSKAVSEFDDIRELFARTYHGQFEPGDAESIARFYSAYPKPRLFEAEKVKQVGWEPFLAWKTAALSLAKQTQDRAHVA